MKWRWVVSPVGKQDQSDAITCRRTQGVAFAICFCREFVMNKRVGFGRLFSNLSSVFAKAKASGASGQRSKGACDLARDFSCSNSRAERGRHNGGAAKASERTVLTGALKKALLASVFALALGTAGFVGAQTIAGTVYNDASGNGNVAGAGGASSISVELYKGNTPTTAVYVSTQTTPASGAYSFSVDSANATYYIRIKQPRINNINAAQTWAGVGGARNISTAFCVDDNGNAQEITISGKCRGVRFAGSDPATNNLANAQIYSKVVMTTNQETARADFGISAAASFGDASSTTTGGLYSSNFKVAYADGGPFHVIANNMLRLGDTVPVPPLANGVADANSNAHPSDDGIFVEIGGGYIPLQGAALANGRTDYKLKAKVGGPFSRFGYLSAWDNTGATPPYAITQKFVNRQDTANSGEIVLSGYSTRAGTGAPTSIITRFRFSSTQGLPTQSTTPGADQQSVGSTSTTIPWVLDGEVEDYQTLQTTAIVRLAAISQGGVGTFNYTMSGVANGPQPSLTTQGSVTTVTPGVRADEDAGPIHSPSNYATPSSVTVTQTPLANRWQVIGVECVDSVSGATQWSTTVVSGSTVTIPASVLGLGGDVVCIFTNKYLDAEAPSSTLTITPDGPVYTGTGSYTATVTGKDAQGVAYANASIVLTVAGGTLTGAGTGTFNPATGACTTDSSGRCTVTWTSANAGTFGIHATLAGTEIGNCVSSPTTCGSQSRQFIGTPDPTKSELTTSKASVTADGSDSARLTVTLKDATGNTTTSIGTTTVNFGGSSPGTFSATSCTISSGGSSCYINITSTVTGTANVTAQIGGTAVRYSPLAVTFTNTAIDLSKSTLVAIPNTLLADGVSTSMVAIGLKDSFGNNYTTSTRVDFSLPASSDGSLSPSFCMTNANGACYVTYTSPNVMPAAGKATVTASVAGAGTKTVDITLTDSGTREIKVTKTVTGSGKAGGYVTGGKFEISVLCGPGTPEVFELADGESHSVIAEVNDTCSIAEAPTTTATVRSNFTNKATYPSIIVVGSESPREISVVNTITSGLTPTYALSIHKTVSGAMAYDDPNAMFTINVSCTGDPDTKIVNIKKGESGYVDVVAGSSCSFNEPSLPPTTDTAYIYVPNIGPKSINEVTSDRDVYVDNIVDERGSMQLVFVQNTVSGQVAGSGYANGQFSVTLNCGTPYTFTATMAQGDISVYYVPNNSACSLTTDTSPGALPTLDSGYVWYAHTSTPSGSFTVTSTTTATADHNIQKSGSVTLNITKRVISAAGGYANGKFAVTVQCGAAAAVPLQLANGDTGTVIAQTGDICTISETVPTGVVAGGFTNEATYPSKIVVGTENPRTIYVDNVITNGTTPTQTLTVKKTVSGAVINHDPNAKFDITVTCAPDPNSVKTVTLMRDEEATVEVAKNAACAISEAPLSALSGYKYVPNIAPSTIADVDADQDVKVDNVVTNATNLRAVNITNTVSGEIAASGYVAGGQFTVKLDCGAGGSFTEAMIEGNTYTYNVPNNSTCTVTTTGWSTLDSHFTWVDTDNLTNPVTADQNVTINHEIKGVTEAAYSTLEIDKVGPVGITPTYTTNNTYTVTVTANNSALVAQPNVDIVLTVTGGTLAAGGTGTFTAGTCTTDSSGKCTVTWTSTTAGTFDIHATLGGVDIGSGSTASPQSRTFYGPVDCTQTTLTANPSTLDANGSSTSTVTVTLKDANGTLVLEPTTVNFTLPGASYGSVGSSCTTDTATGACDVTYTSPSAIPAGNKATVTASGLSCGSKTVDINLANGTNRTVYVHKVVTGTGYVAGTTFAVSVNCGVGYSKVMNLTDGGTDSLVAPLGAICSVTEAEPGASVIGAGHTNAYVIAPAGFTVIGDETVEITNRITNGSVSKGVITVRKSITGDAGAIAAGHIATTEFTVNVACTGLATATFKLKGGQSALVEGAADQQCTISETEPLPDTAVPATYMYVSNIAPYLVPNLPATGIDVTVQNMVMPVGTYYRMTLTNAVTGDPTPSAYNHSGNFTVDVDCGDFHEAPAMQLGWMLYYSVRSGNNCILNTTGRPGITNPLYGWYRDTYAPDTPVTVNGSVNEVVTHELMPTTTRTLTIKKTVSGPAKTAGYVAGTKFAINVQCGAAAVVQLLLADGDTNSTLTAQEGDVCTITEDPPSTGVVRSGSTNTAVISPSSFTVAADTTVNVNNRIETGDFPKKTLIVTKTVDGDPAGDVAGNIFGIEVNCTGTTVADFNLQNGWTATVEGQAGQSCEITEPTIPDAAANYKYVANITPEATTLPDTTSSRTSVTVDVTNTVVPSNVTFYPVYLSNAVNGDPTPSVYNHDTLFVLSMNCATGYNWPTIEMYYGDTVMHQVPAGSNCTMGTTSRPGITNTNYKWDTGTAYSPASPFPVNARVDETATHTIVPSTLRTLTVTKAITGVPAGTIAGKFTIHVDCGGGNARDMALAEGEHDTIQAMDGSVCTTTEAGGTDVGANNSYTAMIVPSKFTVADDTAVTVTNRIETGKPGIQKATVTVTKEVNGVTAQHVASNTFGIEVNCDNTTLADFSLPAGWSASVEGEIGKTCAITEQNMPTPSGAYYYAPSISPATSSLPAAGLDVTVTNTVTPNATTTHLLTLTNAVSGDPTPSAYDSAQPFVLGLNCGAGYANNGNVSMLTGATSSYSVPDGARCSVTTNQWPGLTNMTYQWFQDYYNPASPFDVTADVTETVTHALRRVGFYSVNVTKTVSVGSVAGQFTIHVNCGTYSKDMRLANGETDSLLVPDGSLCGITEDDPVAIIGAGNSNTAVIAPSGFTVTGKDVNVTVDNRITAGRTLTKGTLTVSKTVKGYTAADVDGNVFGIEVNCVGTPIANFNLERDQSASVEGELGATCTISEPTVPPTASPATYAYYPNITPKQTTLQSTQAVSVENMIASGTLYEVTLTNLVNGDPTPSAYDHTGNFTLSMNCGVTAGVSYSWAPAMHTGDTAGFWVPQGNTCDMNTTGWPPVTNIDYVWYSDDYAPASGFTVSNTMTETATHHLKRTETRYVYVTKTVTGGTTASAFAIHVICSDGVNETLTLASGGTDVVETSKGATCSVTEDNNPSAAGSGNSYTALIVPSDFTLGDDDQDVSVENRIETGKPGITKAILKVTKIVVDTYNGHDPAATFDITADCDNTTPASFSLPAGQSATVEGEVGRACTIDEPTEPAAKSGFKYVPNGMPSNITSLPATGKSATIENTVVPDDGTSYHRVYLTNRVVGYTNDFDQTGKFVLSLDCGTYGYWVFDPLLVNDSAYRSVPDDVDCTADTVTRPNPNSGFFWDTTTYRSVPFRTVPVDETQVVMHDLEKAGTAQVDITKTVTGDLSVYQSGTFKVTLACGAAFNGDFTFTQAGGTQTAWVPEGATCTVTEDTSGAVLNNGTSRRTIFPSGFTVGTAKVDVSVENELLNGPVPLAPLTVSKEVTEAQSGFKAAGHDPATAFGIEVDSSLSTKTLSLLDGQSGMTEVMVGDTVDVSEPVIPSTMNTFVYIYWSSVNPSKLMNIPSSGRSSKVTNQVRLTTDTPVLVTFSQTAVNDVPGSGYVSGSILNTTVTCGGVSYPLPLAEGEKSRISLLAGTTCTSAVRGMLPTLNGGYSFTGPTTDPALPYTVSANSAIAITYGILKASPPSNLPIPALDPRALLLLIGLLSGAVFWRSRRQRQEPTGKKG
jgi:hypothetical protein